MRPFVQSHTAHVSSALLAVRDVSEDWRVNIKISAAPRPDGRSVTGGGPPPWGRGPLLLGAQRDGQTLWMITQLQTLSPCYGRGDGDGFGNGFSEVQTSVGTHSDVPL